MLFFSGCLAKQEDVNNILQTNSATIIKNDYKNIQRLLLNFKEKLDKRNPNAYDKNLSPRIYKLISKVKKRLILTQMIDSVSNSLKALGEEPTNLTVGALRGIFLFL
jgi:hypothetical protein